jgi:hypothetical protein
MPTRQVRIQAALNTNDFIDGDDKFDFPDPRRSPRWRSAVTDLAFGPDKRA